jgi:hypothetical protein
LDLASDDILSSLFLCLSLLAAIGLPYMLERAGLDVQQGNVYIIHNHFQNHVNPLKGEITF